jgi:formylglycine-generating enzyme required for sulfatase activity
MDPEIGPGDKVGVYGLYVDDDYVTLSGSGDYYITKTSASNQPSVTVRYPNGGESILTGTQVQVSAHATDDTAVTCVTFYYSRDGGSNWDILGEGARISGTAIDGVWNRTWNTKELSACTNYMMKAVASDGTSTSEDQSDGTFSLVGTLTQVAEWNRTFGGTGDDFAFAVQQTSDGGYVIAGETESYGAGDADFWLLKTDSNGCEQWNKTFGGINSDSAKSVHQTSDGCYIIAGTTYSYGAGAGDFWLIKTGSNGNKQWDKIFGGTSWEVAHSVQQTSDGGYILAGSTKSYDDDGAWDGWLVKTDPNGNQQWEKTFGGIDYGTVKSVRQTSDGGYILAGETVSDFWLVKTDSNGNKQWERTFGGAYLDGAKALQQTRDGGYILAGSRLTYGAGSWNGLLVKTDTNGNELWRLIKVKEGEAEITGGNIITNTIGMEFVPIPAGEFEMGSPSDEGSVHQVNIGYAFYMSRYEVTQKQWRAIMDDNPSSFKGDDLPVEQVSCYDAQEFIKKLNEKESTDKYRLPSEAEWEYACRAGTTSRYSFGDSESKLGDYAWYTDNSGGKTHPVGQKKPNSWGRYDMHGNVWEWVQDAWHSDYNGAPTDGSAWEDPSTIGVLRGGGWDHDARRCRSAYREPGYPSYRGSDLGFRLLKEQ